MAFEITKTDAHVLKHILFRNNSLFRGNSRGRRNLELGQLTGKKLVFGEFRDKLFKLCTGLFWLNKVESIEVSETAFGRMLGYGRIVVIGTAGIPEPFHKVAHPLEFRSQVQQRIEKLH